MLSEMHISQLELWSIFEKKVLHFRRDCNLHQQVRFQASVSFSGDNHLIQWYLFGRAARAFAKDDRLRALLAAVRKPEIEKKRLKERRRPMWTQDPEHGERSCTAEYRPPLAFEEVTRLNCLLSSRSRGYTLEWNLQMMMIMIFMIVNIV